MHMYRLEYTGSKIVFGQKPASDSAYTCHLVPSNNPFTFIRQLARRTPFHHYGYGNNSKPRRGGAAARYIRRKILELLKKVVNNVLALHRSVALDGFRQIIVLMFFCV